MRAIRFLRPNEVAFQDLPDPTPGSGELLCRAKRSMVSTGTETFCLAGEFDLGTNWASWVSYPFAPGYSMVAEVVALGDGVTGFSVGDRVAVAAPHQELVVVAADSATVLPAGVSDEEGCWIPLACTTQWGVRRADLELGAAVAVVGLGLLGQLTVRYLRLAGARRIVAIDTDPIRLDLARRGGATHLVQKLAGDAEAEVRAANDGELLDAVFDITGHPAAFAAASTLLRPLGKVVLVGDSPQPSSQHLGPRTVSDGLTIIGVHTNTAPAAATLSDRWTQDAMGRLFLDYVLDGRMQVEALRTHEFSPAAAVEVYDELVTDRRGHLGVFFDWESLV